ncbi:hypothetical protein [Rufibacter sp. LB8]|uniref:hypothetical protein n=1 Tax=Rufibacter sp. LB8 TaxID=2777781 RepID=UPI00178C3120|nr:hypothetical protein [Rufibacter sp. LB8]
MSTTATSAPNKLIKLANSLRGHTAPRVRTALIALNKDEYFTAPETWASSLFLEPIHLSLHVAEKCQTYGHVGLSPTQLLEYILNLLPNNDNPDPMEPGVWIWGIDILLAKLSENERTIFWSKLHGMASYRPPIVVAIPSNLLSRFGPPEPESTWGTQRFLSLT